MPHCSVIILEKIRQNHFSFNTQSLFSIALDMYPEEPGGKTHLGDSNHTVFRITSLS